MRNKFILIGLLGLSLLLASCGDKLPIETNLDEEVSDFSFKNEHNEPVSLDDLKGEWWISDFIFTNCTTVCLPMTSNMKKLQDQMEENDVTVQLVSFTVDPDHDTPEVLLEYGEEYDADFSSWHFLTGYDFKTIKELSIKSYKAMLKEPDYGDDQVYHDIRYFLISPEGKIVKGYEGIESESVDEIINDLTSLKKNDKL